MAVRSGEPASSGLSAFPGARLPPRALGQSPLQVMPVALGAWGIGGGWGTDVPEPDAIAAISRALELGVTLIDTAPTYGDGASESLIGTALTGRRDGVVIATKCGPLADPAASLETSLARLRTDHVDLFQLHEVPTAPGALEAQLDRMQAQVDRGLARSLGICNASGATLARARQRAPIACVQMPYNIFDRDVEHDHAITKGDLGFLAYRPLASGLLGGAYDAPPTFDDGDHRRRIHWFSGREFKRRRAAVHEVRALATANGLTVAQLALGWLLAQPFVTAVLAGARSVRQIEENTMAWPLSAADVARVNAIVDASYPPRALRAGLSVAAESNTAGEFLVVAPGMSDMTVGAREAHVMRSLDGRTMAATIAASWSAGESQPLLTAQVVRLIDQLDDLRLLEPVDD